MPLEDDEKVYVPTAKLEKPNNPAFWHVDEDCYQLNNAEHGITELTVAEAREECDRQASCCRGSPLPILKEAEEVQL